MQSSTRAITALVRAGVPFRVRRYDPSLAGGGSARSAADILGVEPSHVLKTLIVTASEDLVTALVPAGTRLDVKALAHALGVKRVALAEVAAAERTTGYQVGAISPIGQRHATTTIIDSSVRELDVVFVSAGQRGLELELAPADLAAVAGARFESISHR